MGKMSLTIPFVSLLYTCLALKFQKVVRHCCASSDQSQQVEHQNGMSNKLFLERFRPKLQNKCSRISTCFTSSTVSSACSGQGKNPTGGIYMGRILTTYAARTFLNGKYENSSDQPVMFNPEAVFKIDESLGTYTGNSLRKIFEILRSVDTQLYRTIVAGRINLVCAEAGHLCKNVERTVGTFFEASDHVLGLPARYSSNEEEAASRRPKEYQESLSSTNGKSTEKHGSCSVTTGLCSKQPHGEQTHSAAFHAVDSPPHGEPVEFYKVLCQDFPVDTSDDRSMIQADSLSSASETESHGNRRSHTAPAEFVLSKPCLEECPMHHGLKRKQPHSIQWPASKRLRKTSLHGVKTPTANDGSRNGFMQNVQNLICTLEERIALLEDQFTRLKLQGRFRLKESVHRTRADDLLERTFSSRPTPLIASNVRTAVQLPGLRRLLAHRPSKVAAERLLQPLNRGTSVQRDSCGIRQKTHETLCNHTYRVQNMIRDEHEYIRSLQWRNVLLEKRITAMQVQLQNNQEQCRHHIKQMLEGARLFTLNGFHRVI